MTKVAICKVCCKCHFKIITYLFPFHIIFYLVYVVVVVVFFFEEGSKEISFLHFNSIIHILGSITSIKDYIYLKDYQC